MSLAGVLGAFFLGLHAPVRSHELRGIKRNLPCPFRVGHRIGLRNDDYIDMHEFVPGARTPILARCAKSSVKAAGPGTPMLCFIEALIPRFPVATRRTRCRPG